ncbi:PilZ domain-containing protein [Cognaticolwellia beringensis]|uniref:PilZ domain-containing protein n=1 Tax=Cognaticolwellia beringensis TaxID=1967665 RepID=A0A222G6S2_9GAMM|nr:PilZ domain-containing protein [Cognaticolwellia beringensis]ASP47596.1 PilZ domain-containing protein [Cognaticolwellia beringensis]|tara:strand:+ start:697 stop:1020 length:324 start_codon:yes stop_codon:yes gene_type:complete
MSDIDKIQDSEENERRRSFRLDMEKELIDIVWTDDNGDEKRKKIVCLDFSRGGLKVDCDCEIAANTQVMIIFKAANPNSQKLHGKVIRCIKQDNGWFEVAMQLTDLA